MKKKLGLKNIGFLIVLVMSILMLSCNNDELVEISNSDFALKNGKILPSTLPVDSANVLAEVVQCELIAGQFINAGYVTYEKIEDNIVVSYVASNGWCLNEVHLFVGSIEDLPTNGKAVKIGQFPYSKENLGCVETWEFTIPISDLDMTQHCIIAAHAVVYNSELDQEETAWSNCEYEPVIAVKVKFPDGSNAESDGLSYINNFKNGNTTGIWCDFLGYNFYEIGSEGDEYLLVNDTHFPNDNAGSVLVSDDGEYITILVNTHTDMLGSYVYLGTIWGLENFELHKECPNYHIFPHINEDDGGTEHMYYISIPETQKSVSFNTLFGSNRWGWVSVLW